MSLIVRALVAPQWHCWCAVAAGCWKCCWKVCWKTEMWAFAWLLSLIARALAAPQRRCRCAATGGCWLPESSAETPKCGFPMCGLSLLGSGPCWCATVGCWKLCWNFKKWVPWCVAVPLGAGSRSPASTPLVCCCWWLLAAREFVVGISLFVPGGARRCSSLLATREPLEQRLPWAIVCKGSVAGRVGMAPTGRPCQHVRCCLIACLLGAPTLCGRPLWRRSLQLSPLGSRNVPGDVVFACVAYQFVGKTHYRLDASLRWLSWLRGPQELIYVSHVCLRLAAVCRLVPYGNHAFAFAHGYGELSRDWGLACTGRGTR